MLSFSIFCFLIVTRIHELRVCLHGMSLSRWQRRNTTGDGIPYDNWLAARAIRVNRVIEST